MNLLSLIVISFIATTFMTLYSYAYSRIFNKQFREPVLLHFLFRQPPLKVKNPVWGWVIHFSIGLVFAVGLLLFNFSEHINTYYFGLLYGFVCGIIGIIGWQLMFLFFPETPAISLLHYYFHLMIAHLLFGVVLIECYSFF